MKWASEKPKSNAGRHREANAPRGRITVIHLKVFCFLLVSISERVIFSAPTIVILKHKSSKGRDKRPRKRDSRDNHGSSAEERRAESFLLRLVPRRARSERVERRAGVAIDDSTPDWPIEASGAAESNTSSLAQRPQNHPGEPSQPSWARNAVSITFGFRASYCASNRGKKTSNICAIWFQHRMLKKLFLQS